MKIFLFILLVTTTAYGANSDLLKCMGREELTLHKQKNTNHNYKLNQDMISAMIQLHEAVLLKQQYFSQICSRKTKAPAFELLRTIMVHKQQAFMVALNPKNKYYGVARKSIDELYLRSASVFIDYLAMVRSRAPTVNCITDHIPGLKDFYQKLLYLQEDLDTTTILDSITDMGSIFIKLEYVDSIYKKCAQAANPAPKTSRRSKPVAPRTPPTAPKESAASPAKSGV